MNQFANRAAATRYMALLARPNASTPVPVKDCRQFADECNRLRGERPVNDPQRERSWSFKVRAFVIPATRHVEKHRARLIALQHGVNHGLAGVDVLQEHAALKREHDEFNDRVVQLESAAEVALRSSAIPSRVYELLNDLRAADYYAVNHRPPPAPDRSAAAGFATSSLFSQWVDDVRRQYAELQVELGEATWDALVTKYGPHVSAPAPEPAPEPAPAAAAPAPNDTDHSAALWAERAGHNPDVSAPIVSTVTAARGTCRRTRAGR